MTPWEISGWVLVTIAGMITSAMLVFAVILMALLARLIRQVWREEIRHDKDRG